MLSCKEATQLVSEGLDRELPFWQRLGLRFHVVMCRGCSRFARQITALNRVVADHYGDGPPAEMSEHLPPDAVQRIKSSLRQATPRANNQKSQ